MQFLITAPIVALLPLGSVHGSMEAGAVRVILDHHGVAVADSECILQFGLSYTQIWATGRQMSLGADQVQWEDGTACLDLSQDGIEQEGESVGLPASLGKGAIACKAPDHPNSVYTFPIAGDRNPYVVLGPESIAGLDAGQVRDRVCRLVAAARQTFLSKIEASLR